ncbi:unnamed protein product [Dicrocoelium dendriticum]|nr:unnamed protein product [Dicrocoelium dendriticum]
MRQIELFKLTVNLLSALSIVSLLVLSIPTCHSRFSSLDNEAALYVDKPGASQTPLYATTKDRSSSKQQKQNVGSADQSGMLHGCRWSYTSNQADITRRHQRTLSNVASELDSKQGSTHLSNLLGPAYLTRERRRIMHYLQHRVDRSISPDSLLLHPCNEVARKYVEETGTSLLQSSSPWPRSRKSRDVRENRLVKTVFEPDLHASSSGMFSSHLLWHGDQRQWLSPGRVREILTFISRFVQRYKASFDPTQLYIALYEWELEESRKEFLSQREQSARGRQWKRERTRLREYNRNLRHFASMRTKERAMQLSKARNYDDFHHILFGESSTHDLSQRKHDNHARVFAEPFYRSKLRRASSDQPRVFSSSSSALHFPDGAGGGVFVKTPRYIREIAINDDPDTGLLKSSQRDHDSTVGEFSSQDVVDEEPKHTEAVLRSAFDSYQEFKRTACQPRNQTVCGYSLLELSQHYTNLLIPHGFLIQRCGDQIPRGTCSTHHYLRSGAAEADQLDSTEYAIEVEKQRSCNCDIPEEDCLPIEVALKTQPVVIIQNQSPKTVKHYTELVLLTNHISCGCRPRCLNRICVPPLRFVMQTASDCTCVCAPGDNRCLELLKGKQAFTETEIPMPLNGSFILPPCLYGAMDETSLYHRRCPPKPTLSAVPSL